MLMLLSVLHFVDPKTKYFFLKCLQFLGNLSLKRKYLPLLLKKLRLLQLKVCFPAEWKSKLFLRFCFYVLYFSVLSLICASPVNSTLLI